MPEHASPLRGARALGAAAALAFHSLSPLAASPAAAAPGGAELWRFYPGFAATVVAATPDLSGNGGADILVGSADDTLYLVEGRGAKRGAPLWASPFRSTLSVAIPIGDVTGDGRADVVGGDELGFIQAVNGGTGGAIWRWLTFGTVLSAAALPDVDGDGVPDVAVGSENDTLYCLSGKSSSLLGKVIWQFGAPPKRGRAPGDPPGAPKLAAGPRDGANGINALALLSKGSKAYGLAAAASNDSVYCFPPAGGAPLWKVGLPGDAWTAVAFPDVDGDGIEEVLVASGADAGYLLKGSTGAVIWSHALSMGGISAAASADMTGDGKPDALFGDGGGKVHCVPGNASGEGVAAAWVYDFKDTSTVHSLAALGDVDGDGRGDCAAGTSHDALALITGKGAKAWSAEMGGSVLSVAAPGDLDGNGVPDVVASSEAGFAGAYQGSGDTVAGVLPGRGGRGRPAGGLRAPAAGGEAVLLWRSRDSAGRLRPAGK